MTQERELSPEDINMINEAYRIICTLTPKESILMGMTLAKVNPKITETKGYCDFCNHHGDNLSIMDEVRPYLEQISKGE